MGSKGKNIWIVPYLNINEFSGKQIITSELRQINLTEMIYKSAETAIDESKRFVWCLKAEDRSELLRKPSECTRIVDSTSKSNRIDSPIFVFIKYSEEINSFTRNEHVF